MTNFEYHVERSETYRNLVRYDRMFRDFPDCLSVKDLQRMLNIKKTKAYELLRDKVIPSQKLGRDIKIAKVYVIEFLLGETDGTQRES